MRFSVSSHTATLDSGSFYLSAGSVAHIYDHGEQTHSSSSVHSNDIREQLLTQDDEHSGDAGRSNSTSHCRRQNLPSASARSDYGDNSGSHAPHNDASVNTPDNLFYAHPRLKRIREKGDFNWYRLEGNEPINSPPTRSRIDIRNPFRDADVVVYEALPKNVVQVWCWDDGSWIPIKPGYKRQIFGKTYNFGFAKHSYTPCWLTRETVKRRTLAK